MSKQTDLLNLTDGISVDASGNVGIGTAPAANLHVNSGAANLAGLFESTDAGVTITLIDNSTTGGSVAEHGLNAVGDQLELRAVDNLSFETAGTEAMRIDPSGNVGIGTNTSNNTQLTISRVQPDTTWGTGAHIVLKASETTNDTGFSGISYASSVVTNYGWSVGALRSSTAASSYVFNYHNNSDVGSERMRIDASGYVGIGTAAPRGILDVTRAAGGVDAYFTCANTSQVNFYMGGTTSPQKGVIKYSDNADLMAFHTNSAERMRIDSGGNTMIATSTLGGTGGWTFYPTGSGGSPALYVNKTNGSSTTAYMFRVSGVTSGSITYSSSSVAYNTTSDYRLKENITPVQGAADIVKAMQPVTYTFKSDGSWHDGFLAHELQELHPRAVLGEKDAMVDEEYEVTPAVEATYDDEGVELTPAVPAVMGTRSVPDYQGVDYSKLTPILTAALQEALNKIDALEARLTALEAT